MFCPKCGQQQVSEEIRFCSRCGFRLDMVKACLTADVASVTPAPLSQKSIKLGVILMFLGVLLTSGVVAVMDAGLAGAFFILAVTFITILLFGEAVAQAVHKLVSPEEPLTRQGLPRRRDMSFGATFMFIGTMLSACAATMVPGHMGVPAFFIALITFFALLLPFSHHLMGAVQNLFTDGESLQPNGLRLPVAPGQSIETGDVSQAPALPEAQSTVDKVLDGWRYTTGEVVSPPSVTERTTNLLDDK